jgi:peptide deformylase
MALRPLVLLPDPILRVVSKPFERVDNDVRKLANDMLETMYEAPGIGLAGIQIGEPMRILVMDVAERAKADDEKAAEAEDEAPEEDPERNPIVMINPKIEWSSDDRSVYEEGCLSIPDYYADVERPASVRVSYLDQNGKEQMFDAEGLAATCVQHEIDHLDGKLFIDYHSKLKRDMVIRKFTKLARQNNTKFLG